MMPPILLDLSRLLSRAHRGAPTGIDRVELAYAEYLTGHKADGNHFVIIDPFGRVRRLPAGLTHRFLVAIAMYWRRGEVSAARVRIFAWAIYSVALFCPLVGRRDFGGRQPALLVVSHMHLVQKSRIERALRSTGARFVAFVHDLIPIEYPEYVRPNHAERHTQRIETVASLADAVIVNSQSTALALEPWLEKAGRMPPVSIAPLGVDIEQLPPVAPCVGGLPYFVLVGTIEPRKNHIILLHIWRRLAERYGADAARLVLVGRRGWENENIVDLLERSPSVMALVSERSDMSDTGMYELLRGSRAVLFPSFAEGYGLPLAEALALGVPALCADIPALREVGCDVPDYLDPLDGLGWLEAIEAYSDETSPRRLAQLARMPGWVAPSWQEHFVTIRGILASSAVVAPCAGMDEKVNDQES